MTPALRSFATSRALIAAAADVLPGGVGSDYRAGPTALVIERAAGATVIDADGNRLIDYVCGAGPIILGHDHPAVVDAVIDQVRRGVQTGAESRAEHAAAALAVELIPCAEQVRFTNSGSEAVLLALRLARAATGRTGIVKLQGSYHGWSDPVMVGGPGRAADDPGTAGADPGARAATHVVPTWDLDAIEAVLRTGTVAALLVEPYHRGHRWHPPGFLESLRALTARHGTLLVFDEVLSGFRVGPGGAQGLLGITPDLSTFAKAVANGHAVGGVAGPRRILSLMGGGPVLHPGTYNGNPLGMAAAVATMTELRTGVPYERIHEHGGRLMDGLGTIARTRWPEAAVQGLPASFRLSLGEPAAPEDAARLAAETTALVLALLERGVRIVPGATWYLNAAHDAPLIDETLAAVAEAVAALPEPASGA